MSHESPYLAKCHNIRLDSAQDAFQVIGAGVGPLIFTVDDLAPDFFNLRNGMAGDVFQKLTTYGVRAAFVIPDDHQLGERVTELAREHRQHSVVRITNTINAAHQWLAATAR